MCAFQNYTTARCRVIQIAASISHRRRQSGTAASGQGKNAGAGSTLAGHGPTGEGAANDVLTQKSKPAPYTPGRSERVAAGLYRRALYIRVATTQFEGSSRPVLLHRHTAAGLQSRRINEGAKVTPHPASYLSHLLPSEKVRNQGERRESQRRALRPPPIIFLLRHRSERSRQESCAGTNWRRPRRAAAPESGHCATASRTMDANFLDN